MPVAVGVNVGVQVAVAVAVAVPVAVGVNVGVQMAVVVGVATGVAVKVGVKVAVAVGVVTDWTTIQLTHPCDCAVAPVSLPTLRSVSKDVLDMTLPLRNNRAKQTDPDITTYNGLLIIIPPFRIYTKGPWSTLICL